MLSLIQRLHRKLQLSEGRLKSCLWAGGIRNTRLGHPPALPRGCCTHQTQATAFGKGNPGPWTSCPVPFICRKMLYANSTSMQNVSVQRLGHSTPRGVFKSQNGPFTNFLLDPLHFCTKSQHWCTGISFQVMLQPYGRTFSWEAQEKGQISF